MLNKIILFLALITLQGCNILSKDEDNFVARFQDSYLTKSELSDLMGDYKLEDSSLISNNLINEWAVNKILVQKAKLNLNQSVLDNIESLVNEYHDGLLSDAFLQAYINSSINLDIDTAEINYLFDENRALLTLNQDVFKMVFIELSEDFSDLSKIRNMLKKYRENDIKFLDSISYKFKSFSFDDKKWITKKKLIQKFPFLTNYSFKTLKNYNFYQYKDSLSLYLIKIIEYANVGDESPIEYALPTLEYISLNKRKEN